MRYATLREKSITDIMRSNGILTVEDLSLENLCEVFCIDIEYHPQRSQCFHEDDENYALVYLDSRLPFREQRFKFFHEFAHILSHPGNQRILPRQFIELQENQSYWMALYSSMPRYIFEPLAHKHHSSKKLADLFELPESEIISRFETIKREKSRQEFQNKMKHSDMLQRKKSLQPGEIYDSTLIILKKLEKQVGKENLHHDIARLL